MLLAIVPCWAPVPAPRAVPEGASARAERARQTASAGVSRRQFFLSCVFFIEFLLWVCQLFLVLRSWFFLLDSCFLIPCAFFFLRLLKAQKVAKIDHSVIFFGTGPRAEWVAQSSCFFELCGSWFGQTADFLSG